MRVFPSGRVRSPQRCISLGGVGRGRDGDVIVSALRQLRVCLRRRCALASLLACAAGGPSTAAAQPACPSVAAVADALRAVGPAEAEAAITRGIVVEDAGDGFVVSIAGTSRTFADADRDCARRAEWAAAFVALAISPDRLTPPPPAPAPPTPSATPRSHGLAVELGARAGAPGAIGSLGALGFSDRVAWWWAAHRWSLAMGFGSPLTGTMETSAVPVRVRAWPADLSLRRRLGADRRFGVALDAGLALEWVTARSEGVARSGANASRLDPGLRLAVTPRVRLWRTVEGFAGMELGVFPWSPTLDVVPEADVGRVSRLRPRLVVGVGWSL